MRLAFWLSVSSCAVFAKSPGLARLLAPGKLRNYAALFVALHFSFASGEGARSVLNALCVCVPPCECIDLLHAPGPVLAVLEVVDL